MSRLLPILAALFLTTPALAAEMSSESGVNYPGYDIRRDVNVSAQECSNRCYNLHSCRSYTWVPAGVQGPQPVCWLKHALVGAVSTPGMISGRKYKWDCSGWCHCNDGGGLKDANIHNIEFRVWADAAMQNECNSKCSTYRVETSCWQQFWYTN